MDKKGFLYVFVVLIIAATLYAGFYYLSSKADSHIAEKVISTTPTISPTPSALPSNGVNQETVVISVVKAHSLKNGYTDPVISTDFVQSLRARGNVSDKNMTRGAKWFAAKIDGEWTVVHVGNGMPSCNTVSKYKLPKEFLACY